jgi:hypothetical protein
MLQGTNKHDPNDWCPHQNRRELRGLYVMASFANHFDVKDHNSMNVYVGEDGEGYLEHYLMDFGSTFGSAGYGPMQPTNGYANSVDVRDMGVSMITLGFKKWQWEDATPVVNKSVGYYEADIFHPAKWDPVYPIPPFENMTAQDGYWGAKIVMAFTDEYLRALIRAGQYSDKEAERILFETMKKRRDKIGRYWFDKINPLDYPTIQQTAGGVQIDFKDLAVEYNLTPKRTAYQYEIRYRGKTIINPREIMTTRVDLSESELQMLAAAGENNKDPKAQEFIYELRIKTARNNGKWSDPAVFWFYHTLDGGTSRIISIEHPG